MSQPTPYDREFNFTGFSSANPNQQQPGIELDAELNAIALTLEETLSNLAVIQRDDTRLANASVGPDQLDDMALLLIGQGGFSFKGLWGPSIIYAKGDVVSFSSEIYLVVSDHISNAAAAVDITAGRLHGPILPVGSMGGGGGSTPTNLSVTRDANTVTVLSDTGSDATLQPASTSEAGVMTAGDKAALNALVAAGGGTGSTNLSFTRTATNLTVASDTGTDATLPAAAGGTTPLAGVMTGADKVKLDGLSPGGGTVNAVNFVTAFGGVGNGTTNNDAAIALAEASAYEVIWLPEGRYVVTTGRDTFTKKYVGPGIFLYPFSYRAAQNAASYSADVAPTATTAAFGINATKMTFTDFDYRTTAAGTRRNHNRYYPSGDGTGPSATQYFWAPSTPKFSIFENRGGWSGTSGVLSASVSAGATTCTLNGGVSDWSAAGLIGKQIGFVDPNAYDGVPSEYVTVTGASGSTLTFTPALASGYAAGWLVSHGYRTMNTHEFKEVTQWGGGDCYAYLGNVVGAYTALASQQSTFQTATVGIIGGSLTLVRDGNYGTGWECVYDDTNTDGAIIASVQSFERRNNTAARDKTVWLNDLIKMDGGGTGYAAYGLKPLDGVYTVAVAARTGLDFTRSAFSVAAVALPLGQRIGFDAEMPATPGSSNGWGFVAETINSMFIRGNLDVAGKFLSIQNQSSGFIIRPTAIQATSPIDAVNNGFTGNIYRLSDPVTFTEKGKLIAGTDVTSDYIDLFAGSTYRLRMRPTGELEFNGDVKAAATGKVAWKGTNSYLFYDGSVLRFTNDNGATSAALGAGGISRGAITGLTLANDATNPNTHITIAVGQARDSTDVVDLKLTTGLTKRLDAAWAVGTGNGALDAGSVAGNKGYHVFLIRRASDGLLDVLMSLSAVNPVMPSGWTAFRRIGAILVNASTFIKKFTQHGDYFELYERSAEFAGVANGSGPYLRQMVCPTGIPLKLRVFLQSQTAGGGQLVTFSGVFDPALGIPQLATLKRAQIRRTVYLQSDSAYGAYGIFDGDVWCDASGQVYTHSDNTSDNIALGLYGWTDDRGQYQ
jgi:hypothetical protein